MVIVHLTQGNPDFIPSPYITSHINMILNAKFTLLPAIWCGSAASHAQFWQNQGRLVSCLTCLPQCYFPSLSRSQAQMSSSFSQVMPHSLVGKGRSDKRNGWESCCCGFSCHLNCCWDRIMLEGCLCKPINRAFIKFSSLEPAFSIWL